MLGLKALQASGTSGSGNTNKAPLGEVGKTFAVSLN